MRAQRVTLPGHLSEAASQGDDVRVRDLGTVAYAEAWEAMHRFTTARGPTTVDEVWLLDHPPVYTLGLNGKPVHVLDPGTIPVLRSDRGGQVTYHGPGQLVVYVLVDLARRGLGLRRLVYVLEQAVIDLCAGLGVEVERRAARRGVCRRCQARRARTARAARLQLTGSRSM